ncbi:RNA-directed DNA polymerase [Janthinobacterium sp. Marseille]|nr:retron St85 family RNA-directed DNA polymerase [Janthinobacterium sp. Marseille]ABR91636.1 RNA-directed DNA polymerase [Janthinobacterium sp. Marseille]
MKTNEWRAYFEDRGVSTARIDKYVSYIECLSKKNQPVIFELDHLSSLLGIQIEYLSKMIASSHSFYRKFSIPKRSGGKREILAPYESLLTCQQWILKNILKNIPLHSAAHGFRSGKSIKTNALAHINGKALLKMDLKDFFPSIPLSWIIKTFQDIGYAPNVAYYLASLCCYDEKLAQGAATSPALSNIVLTSLDKRLDRLAKKCSITYTRYADDLTFSGEHIHSSFSKLVTKIVDEYGLVVNTDKTRLKVKNGTRIVTGIGILNGRLSIPREYKRELKNEIFFIRKFGFVSHLSNKKISNPNYINSLLGKISFWLYIEPDNQLAIDSHKLVLQLIND